MKKVLTLILSILMFCSIGSAIAFADSVTGSETDRSKIGATNPAWNNPAWAEPIKTAMLDEYERLEGIGFNPGSIADYIGHWEIGFKQDFNNSDGTYAPWGDTRDLIMFYNALKDKAYSLYNKPYEVWNSGTNKDSLLMPTSNQYTIAGSVYQNFAKGYIKDNDIITGKNVKDIETATEVEEVVLTKGQMYAHTYSSEFWNNLGGNTMHQASKAMSDAILALENTGFNVGEGAKEGIKAWATGTIAGTILVVDIYNSGSNTSIWGDARNAMVVYNSEKNKAYVLYDEIAKQYTQFQLTAPISDMFTVDGVKYQNFANGYVKVVEGTATTVLGKNVNSAGNEAITGSESDRNMIGANEWGNPAWAEPIKTAMLAEYVRLEEMSFNPGTVAGYIGWWEIGFKQDFNSSDGTYAPWGDTRNLIMFYNALKDKAYSLYNKPYEVWNSGTNKDSLLMPTSNQYTIEGSVYQNFAKGYIKDEEIILGKNIKDIETATAAEEVTLTNGQMYAHTYSNELWNNLGGKQMREVVGAMSQAVLDLEATGFDVGTASKDGVKVWATGQDSGNIIIADMLHTDSTNYIWSEADGRDAMIMYNINTGDAYVLYDEIASKYIEFQLTTPKSVLFTVEGVKYQNFTNGYIKVEDGVATTVLKKNVNEQGVEVSAFEASDTGVFDNGVVAEENVKTAVSTKILEIATANTLGVPLSYVLNANENTYYQSFDGTTVYVKVSVVEETVTAQEIVLSGAINTAYTTKYGFHVPEDELGASKTYVLGVPVESFVLEGVTYVNFERGVITWDGEADEATVSAGFIADETGTLKDIVFDGVAFINPAFTMPSNVTLTEDELIAKFNAKYQALMLDGYNLGVPDDGGISLWTDADYVAGSELTSGKGWIKQGFIGGSGEGFTFGVTSYLVYNIDKNEVYLIRDYVQNQVQYILYEKGAPTADTIENGNKMQQQFEKGYINAMEAWGTFMFFDGKNIGDPLDDENPDEGGNYEPEEKKGCGSVVFASSAISGAIVLLAGATLICKKRTNNR